MENKSLISHNEKYKIIKMILLNILSSLGYSPVHGAGDLDYPHAVKYTVCITSIFRRQEER
jgi:hypothetical protein